MAATRLGRTASGFAMAGHLETAMELVEEALRLQHHISDEWMRPELLRLKGELSLKHNFAGEEAERLFGEALSVARREGLRWLELRAGGRLADVLCGVGRHADASELLAPITAWFTEGKTLPDFKAALEVLERAQQCRLH